MMLKLAKWCSIIPFFVYAAFRVAVLTAPVYYHPFALVPLVFLSVFVVPVLAVLGIVLSAVLIFRKERKAMKFLVLSCVNIIISALAVCLFLYLVP